MGKPFDELPVHQPVSLEMEDDNELKEAAEASGVLTNHEGIKQRLKLHDRIVKNKEILEKNSIDKTVAGQIIREIDACINNKQWEDLEIFLNKLSGSIYMPGLYEKLIEVQKIVIDQTIQN